MKLSCPSCFEETEFNPITECRCNEDVGGGYTYQSEFGDCEAHSFEHPAICTDCNGCFELEHLLRLTNRICCDELGYPAGEALFMDTEEWEKENNKLWEEFVDNILKELHYD